MTVRSRSIVLLAAAGAATALLGVPAASAQPAQPAAAPMSIASCTSPNTPSWFVTREAQAAQAAGDQVPDSWSDSLNIRRIACYESTFNPDAVNGQYYGLGQLNQTNCEAEGVSWYRYRNGTADHPASYYQTLAMMRYVKDRYGDTTTAWQHEVTFGWY